MSDLLNNPAVQAGFVPFLVALVIGFALARTRFGAVAVASGVVVVMALTVGFSLEPLTSVKKLMLSAALATVLSLALEAAGAVPRHASRIAMSAIAGAMAVWAIVRVLAQMESFAPWGIGFAVFVFVVVMVGSSMVSGARSSIRAAVVGAVLGWGSGVMALLGASALLAQIGLAVGSASAALALVQMLRGREAPLGFTLVVPAAVTAATVVVLASATGELRWWCLLPLPFAPLAALASPLAASRPVWQRGFVAGFIALVPVALAVGLAWWSGISASAGA